MPLKFIPAAFGNWSLKGGVQFLVLNSNLKAINFNDNFRTHRKRRPVADLLMWVP